MYTSETYVNVIAEGFDGITFDLNVPGKLTEDPANRYLRQPEVDNVAVQTIELTPMTST